MHNLRLSQWQFGDDHVLECHVKDVAKHRTLSVVCRKDDPYLFCNERDRRMKREKLMIERNHIRDGVYITLAYSIDDENTVHCASLTPGQLERFAPYALELQKSEPKNGAVLREASAIEVELWARFVETLLICGRPLCPHRDVLFNAFQSMWLCSTHATGLETPTSCAVCGSAHDLSFSSKQNLWLCLPCWQKGECNATETRTV